MHRVILVLVSTLVACGLLFAQTDERAPAPSPETVKLTISPAAAPSPALKYQLLPEAKDLQPGNALLLYYRAYSPEWWNYGRDPDFWDKLQKWQTMPLADLVREELKFAGSKQLMEVDLAARRVTCDWELLPRVRQEGMSLLLPDVQGFRTVAHLLGLRARLEMAEGRHDKAIYTLQTCFQLGKHISEGPTLIHVLVGLVAANEACKRLDELIQQPGTPNFYWALAQFPRPLIDVRKALQGENLLFYSFFPDLDQMQSKVWDDREARRVMDILVRLMQVDGTEPDARLSVLALTIKGYPAARRFLLNKGVPRERVEAMPAMQVVLLYSLDEYNRLRDEYFKWHAFPFYQARGGYAKADQQIKQAKVEMNALPLGPLFVPAVDKVFTATARTERRLDALRCIEAIRIHAAANGGRLPQSLGDISSVLVPIDPITGKEFQYRVEGNGFVLESPAPAGGPVQLGLRYEVTMKR